MFRNSVYRVYGLSKVCEYLGKIAILKLHNTLSLEKTYIYIILLNACIMLTINMDEYFLRHNNVSYPWISVFTFYS